MLMKVFSAVLNSSKWRMQDENLSFWYEKWLMDGPLFQNQENREFPNLMLANCKQDYGWNVDLFDKLVGLEQSKKILEELGSVKQGKDILIWLPNAQENLSTRSTWECIQARAPKIPLE